MLASASSCASLRHQPTGRIAVQVVSWPLVKKLAEPDAGLPGYKVTILKPSDHSLAAEKLTDSDGANVKIDGLFSNCTFVTYRDGSASVPSPAHAVMYSVDD
jgi:hypothetical protein